MSTSFNIERSWLSWFWVEFKDSKKIRSHKSRAEIPSNLSPASKDLISDSVELCETDVLLLKHPTYWNKCMTSKKMHNVPPEEDFESSRSPEKIRVLTQSQPALFLSITHLTILCVFTCVMNVGNQEIQAFVTGSGPFRNRSCTIVHWPQNIRSSNTCQVQAFQKKLFWIRLTISRTDFRFFLYEMIVINAWSRYFVELLSRLVC